MDQRYHLVIFRGEGVLSVVRRSQPDDGSGSFELSDVHEVRLRHEDELLALPGVVGVADTVIGGRAMIQVFVNVPAGQPVNVPSELDGYPVEIISSGDITPLV